MALWSYTKKPMFRQVVEHDAVAKENGWCDLITGETLVAINRFNEKHDVSVDNIECEDGVDLLLEDSTNGEQFILLEN